MQGVTFLDTHPDFERVDSGKSPAYFARFPNVSVGEAEIAALFSEAEALGQVNMRICLHGASDDPFHNMIILEYPGSRYFRPHRHREKGETCHMIDGSLQLFVFDDDGRILKSENMSADDNPIFRVGAKQWHTLIPVSSPVIYHESKPGPFFGDEDSLYPTWAPDGVDENEAQRYVQNLMGEG
ncbi:MAG: WbuC family cupin fold metalloprotein [Magnetovibrio sp.]|nr:WbuC family cupin fold metalloprotein [Magnetovibrio sp.]